jgi:hypothetical protein
MKSFDDDQLARAGRKPPTENRDVREQHQADADSRVGLGQPLGTGHVLALQRSVGNAAVAQLLADDEQDEDPSPVHDVVGKGGGQPIPDASRAKMESSFGQDFSQVRIHTDSHAAESARSVQALAYTVGDDIVFGSGSPSLESPAGQHGLAHELTHVVQQRSGPVEGTPAPGGIQVSDPSDRFETQAERVATAVQSGDPQMGDLGVETSGAGAFAVQRQEEDEEEMEES